MDEKQDASGQGLLQTAGLDATGGAVHEGDSPHFRSAGHPGVGPGAKMETVPGARTVPSGLWQWWKRYLERRRRPHAPGVWVLYFSLAALPMFGLGQAFIPLAKETSRRYAFLLLAI